MEDADVFFDPDDFATLFRVVGRTPPNDTIAGIMGMATHDALQGLAVGVRGELIYPAGSVPLSDGDELQHDTRRFKVVGSPEFRNDGQELAVRLSEIRA